MPPKKYTKPHPAKLGKGRRRNSESSYSESEEEQVAPMTSDHSTTPAAPATTSQATSTQTTSSPAVSTTTTTKGKKRPPKTPAEKAREKKQAKERRANETSSREEGSKFLLVNAPDEYQPKKEGEGPNSEAGYIVKAFMKWASAGFPLAEGSNLQPLQLLQQQAHPQPQSQPQADPQQPAPFAAVAEDFDNLPEEDFTGQPEGPRESPSPPGKGKGKDKDKGKGKAADDGGSDDDSDDSSDGGSDGRGGDFVSEPKQGGNKRPRSPSPVVRNLRPRTAPAANPSAPAPAPVSVPAPSAPSAPVLPAGPSSYVSETTVQTRTGPSRPPAPLIVNTQQTELSRLDQLHRRVQQQAAGAVQRAGGQADEQTRRLLDGVSDQLVTVVEILARVGIAEEEEEGAARQTELELQRLERLHARVQQLAADVVQRAGEQADEQTSRLLEGVSDQLVTVAETLARVGEQREEGEVEVAQEEVREVRNEMDGGRGRGKVKGKGRGRGRGRGRK